MTAVNHQLLELQAHQFAVFYDEGWQAFDSLVAAREFALDWVSRNPAGEIKIYDARQQFVKSVRNGQAHGGMPVVRTSAPWWQFWR